MPGPDLEVRQRRMLLAPRPAVWKAWTDPAVMLAWFAPLGMTATQVEADVRVGGAFRITMRLDGAIETLVPQRDGAVVAHGTYEQVSEPSLLVFSWSWEGFDETGRVRIDLVDHGGRTELLLVHRQLTSVASQRFHEHGWKLTVDHLELSLTPVPPNPSKEAP